MTSPLVITRAIILNGHSPSIKFQLSNKPSSYSECWKFWNIKKSLTFWKIIPEERNKFMVIYTSGRSILTRSETLTEPDFQTGWIMRQNLKSDRGFLSFVFCVLSILVKMSTWRLIKPLWVVDWWRSEASATCQDVSDCACPTHDR